VLVWPREARVPGAMRPPVLQVQLISRRPLVAAGLARLIEEHPDRVAVVEAPPGRRTRTDVAVLDLLDLADPASARQLNGFLPAVPVVGLVRDGTSPGRRPGGVVATVSESVSSDALVGTLLAAASRRSEPRPSVELSARELDVLALIASGRSNQEIADDLCVSINTVKTYIRGAYQKVGVQRRPEAILWALDLGLTGRRVERG
jgi:DNA-binding NarL/FixJ family response regulator